MRFEVPASRAQASGTLTTEAGPPAGSSEETRKAAENGMRMFFCAAEFHSDRLGLRIIRKVGNVPTSSWDTEEGLDL